VFAVVTCETTN